MKTRVFTNGNSQAVRIPAEFRLNCSSVEIVSDGNRLVITPEGMDPWAGFKQLLKEPITDLPDREAVKPETRDWS